MFTSRLVGTWEASQPRTVALGRLFKTSATKRGVIYHAGITKTDRTFYTEEPHASITKALTDAGYPVVSFNSEETWGNSTGTGRVTDAKTDAQSNWGFASGKVFLVASSMGATTCLNWAKANPTLVQAMVLMIPAVDIQDINTNDRGSYASSIQTAWGGAPSDANTPAKNASSFTAIPTKIFYSTDDPICTPTTVTTFASAAGASTVSLGANGHSALGTDPNAVASFLNANS